MVTAQQQGGVLEDNPHLRASRDILTSRLDEEADEAPPPMLMYSADVQPKQLDLFQRLVQDSHFREVARIKELRAEALKTPIPLGDRRLQKCTMSTKPCESVSYLCFSQLELMRKRTQTP